jgi:hypothetical protein
MTTPPQPSPPQPPAPPQPAPPQPGAPPQPAPPQPRPPAEPGLGPAGEAALEAERRKNRELETRLATLEQASMTEQEKAVRKAHADGVAEATATAARRLAATEFRYAAAGRIADPAAALELLDVGKLLDEHGEPDSKRIAAAVDRLAGPPPDPAANGHQHQPRTVPAGPRPPAAPPAGGGDFIRSVLKTGRGR